MKRLFCLVILFVMAFSVAAAETVDLTALSEAELIKLKDDIDAELQRRADMPEDPITGTWYLSEVIINGQRMDVSTTGVSSTLEIRADTTFTLTANGIQNSGMWSREGDRYNLAGSIMTLSDGKLIGEDDQITMVFIRDAVGVSVTQTVSASGEEEFLGEWKLDRVGQNGVVVPITIGSESYEVEMNVQPGAVAITWSDLHTTDRLESAFVDGRLVLSGETAFGIHYSPLEKTDDGGIRTTVESGDYGIETVDLYFVKVPEPVENEPIPTFGLTSGMTRDQIVSRMEGQGLKLFEEQSLNPESNSDGYLGFYGDIGVFGRKATVVVIYPYSLHIEYVFYFFDKESGFWSRLPTEDAMWYQTEELAGVHEDLYRGMVDKFGEPTNEGNWWKIGSDYYSLSDYPGTTPHMLIFSIH